jgi:hypothetical protein
VLWNTWKHLGKYETNNSYFPLSYNIERMKVSRRNLKQGFYRWWERPYFIRWPTHCDNVQRPIQNSSLCDKQTCQSVALSITRSIVERRHSVPLGMGTDCAAVNQTRLPSRSAENKTPFRSAHNAVPRAFRRCARRCAEIMRFLSSRLEKSPRVFAW